MIKASKPLFRGAFGLLRFLALRFHRDKGLELAAALSFSSLLAAVPLAAIALSAISQVELFAPLREAFQRELVNIVAPTIAQEVGGHLSRFLENARRLTLPGLIGLLATASLLVWTIHNAMIRIWRSERRRNLLVRLLSYWAVIVLGPLFVGLSVLVSAFLSEQALSFLPWDGINGGGRGAGADPDAGPGGGSAIIALPLATLGLFILYHLASGRPVKMADAFFGALAAAVLIEISKFALAVYVDQLTAYEAVYGALSLLPVTLLWLYFLWIMVLAGAEVAAGLPEWRRAIEEEGQS